MRSAGGGSRGRREGPGKLPLFAAAAILACLLPLIAACGGNPPQIVDYSPQRGAVDVSTAAPIRVAFDHDVDKPSVESRLHLSPTTVGAVRWLSGRSLELDHDTLRTSTTYEVILDPGYHDLAGNVYTLRHHWAFTTEAAPGLVSSAPSDGDRAVDPAAYLTLDFTRDMDAASLKSAVTLEPSVPVDVRLDPTDGRRAIIAPEQLLTPNTNYTLAVNTGALDADGNQIDRDQTVAFTTGSLRPLHGWITFAVQNTDGSAGGAWMVDDQGFPRRLYDAGSVIAFSWSASGDRLLVEDADGTWSELVPGGTATPLPFKGTWAAGLANGLGYVYIDNTRSLHRLTADGSDQVITSDVNEATVQPGGMRVAFVAGSGPDLSTIWGYDVGLQARYQLAADSGPVTNVAWAPDGDRIAYLRHDAATTTLRVRNLVGSGTTTTVASGDLGAPSWLADSLHVVLAAAVPAAGSSAQAIHKAFVLNAATPPPSLSAVTGIPSDPTVDVISPTPSPDGHQIAFLNQSQVWLMNADGTRPTPLTTQDPAGFPYSCLMPAWTRS